MIKETERSIVPLDAVFSPKSVCKLRFLGATGVIPLEAKFRDLVETAVKIGYSVLNHASSESDPEIKVFSVHDSGDYIHVSIFVRSRDSGEEIYVCDDELGDFKEMFLGGVEG